MKGRTRQKKWGREIIPLKNTQRPQENEVFI